MSAAVAAWSGRARRLSLAFAALGAGVGGAWLTRRIGAAGSMLAIADSVDFVAQINAIAHAVVFGWLALACVAAGWRLLPARWGASLPWPRWCPWIVGLLAGGAATHALGQWCAPHAPWGLDLALASAVAETAALTLVATQVLTLRARRTTSAPPVDQLAPLAVVAAAAAAAFDAWHTARVGAAADLASLIAAVRLSQPPLRDLELHACAAAWLLALRWATDAEVLPTGRARIAAWLLGLGTVGEIGLYFAYRLTGDHALAALMLLPWLAVGAGFLAAAPRGWWRGRVDLATAAACAWFVAAIALRLGFRPYHVWRGVAFSHAYFAALGQAAAVGFVAQALIALDARLRGRRALATVIALNLGCLLHVVAQIGLDWRLEWGPLLTVAGLIEGAAIIVWAASSLRTQTD